MHKQINIEDIIIDKTKYSQKYYEGLDDDAIVISASQVGTPLYQLYLANKHRKDTRQDNKITDGTLGTILHIGMEQIMSDVGTNHKLEYSMRMDLGNNIYLSGTADMISGYDTGDYEIRDYKFIKKYSIQSVKSKKENHQYSLQLATLKCLLSEEESIEFCNIHSYIDFFTKDAMALKSEPVFTEMYIPTLNKEQIIEKVREIGSKIRGALNGEIKLDKCDDVWFRKTPTGAIPMRCHYYCDYKDKCKFLNTSPQSIVNAAVQW